MGELVKQATSGYGVAAESDATQYLTFLAGQERFAISILDVKEIIEVSSMTNVPMTPDFIRGVINLRGSVVPVVDLSVRLGKQRSELDKRSCIILVEIETDAERQTLGMLVDEVNEILEIDADSIQPPPNFGTDIRTDFIHAMGRVDDTFIILLNINRVLSLEELSQIGKLSRRLEHTAEAEDWDSEDFDDKDFQRF